MADLRRHRGQIVLSKPCIVLCVQPEDTYDTLCFVFLRLVYPMLPVSLECPFVIALSVFSDVYFVLNLLEVSVMIFCRYQQKGHLTSLNTKTMTYDVGNAGPWLRQIKYCGGVKMYKLILCYIILKNKLCKQKTK
jgi:hypothetical protein